MVNQFLRFYQGVLVTSVVAETKEGLVFAPSHSEEGTVQGHETAVTLSSIRK